MGARDLFAPELSDASCSVIQAAFAVKEAVLTMSRTLGPPARPRPSSTRDPKPGEVRRIGKGPGGAPVGRFPDEPEHYPRDRDACPVALSERGSPAWHRPLEDGAVVDAAFDDGVRGARHLGSDRRERLAAEIGIVPIARDVALELGSEAVVALADRDLPGHPQGPAQARVAELGELGLASALPIEAPSVQARWATPDCWVERSRSSSFRNWRWWAKRLRSFANVSRTIGVPLAHPRPGW